MCIRSFRTKKQRKTAKEDKAIEKDMKEANAVVDLEERDRNQGDLLKLVIQTYLTILKEAEAGANCRSLVQQLLAASQDMRCSLT